MCFESNINNKKHMSKFTQDEANNSMYDKLKSNVIKRIEAGIFDDSEQLKKRQNQNREIAMYNTQEAFNKKHI